MLSGNQAIHPSSNMREEETHFLSSKKPYVLVTGIPLSVELRYAI